MYTRILQKYTDHALRMRVSVQYAPAFEVRYRLNAYVNGAALDNIAIFNRNIANIPAIFFIKSDYIEVQLGLLFRHFKHISNLVLFFNL